MKYTGTTYRPPYEADSLLVQVTQGCSHNRCSCCTMYRDVPFAVESIEQIEHDLREARRYYGTVERIFLLNGDAFVLGFDRLRAIGEKIIEIFPEASSIGCYASIENIVRKSDEELAALRALRYDMMNIGVESGHDDVLCAFNKGFTAEEAERGLLRLNAHGFRYCVNIIVGGGGTALSAEHAAASARLINRVQPWMVFLMTLFLTQGSPLHAAATHGAFEKNTAGDNLREEGRLIRALDLRDTILLGMHTSNAVPLAGRLPMDKERILGDLRRGIGALGEDCLAMRPRRGAEGRYAS